MMALALVAVAVAVVVVVALRVPQGLPLSHTPCGAFHLLFLTGPPRPSYWVRATVMPILQGGKLRPRPVKGRGLPEVRLFIKCLPETLLSCWGHHKKWGALWRCLAGTLSPKETPKEYPSI